MRIRLESPDQPDVLRLIDELDAYQRPLYPAESHHGIDLTALLQPQVLFAVARDAQGRALGCGAMVLGPACAEVKRMFVSPAARGAGLGSKLLAFLEARAAASGCTRFMLETGHLQPEALSLYARSGYERCGPFGDYVEDPNSLFMRKTTGALAEDVEATLDRLADAFFRAVSFEAGETPAYDGLHGLFIEAGLLIKNTASTPEISSVSQFIAPRRAMVQAGELVRFRETELSAATQVFGNVAQRFSAYSKSGTMKGVAFEARGMISTQFVSTPDGWKISAMAWDDERPGLAVIAPEVPSADREFVHSRLIDAPREQVYRAFAQPERLARWWGPNGFTNTFQQFDLWPGGHWRFVMHGPDGTDHPNESVFLEVAAPRRVVFEHLSEQHHFLMHIGFEARGSQTMVHWRQVFDTAEHKQHIAAFVAAANEQNLDRLAAEVARTG